MGPHKDIIASEMVPNIINIIIIIRFFDDGFILFILHLFVIINIRGHQRLFKVAETQWHYFLDTFPSNGSSISITVTNGLYLPQN